MALFRPNSVKFQLDERNAEEDKTVHWKITALWGGKKVELRETQRAVTPFGGLVVFLNATAGNKERCADRTRASMDGLRIIRCWRYWPKHTFCYTAGCGAATAAR